MSHHEAGMAGVQNPAECLCEIIGWVDNARDVLELNVSKFVPLLEPKVSNLHMARAFSGLGVVDNLDGGLIVFKDGSGSSLDDGRADGTKFLQDRAELQSNLGHGGSGNQLSFSGTVGNDGLSLGSVGDDSSS